MRITDFKYCSKCNLHKHRDEYAKNAHTRDGLNNWCKKCQWVQRNANGIPAICRQCSKQFMKCKNRRTFCSRACRIASTRKYDPIKLAELAKTGATSTDMAKALGVSEGIGGEHAEPDSRASQQQTLRHMARKAGSGNWLLQPKIG
jgi:hypothetical protein